MVLASASGLLGGGKENKAGDGVTKIGRIYSVKLFGEETDAGSLYDENDMAFVIVLKELYNYELMEFSNPGSMTIRFYQDAYYTAEEKRPAFCCLFLSKSSIFIIRYPAPVCVWIYYGESGSGSSITRTVQFP